MRNKILVLVLFLVSAFFLLSSLPGTGHTQLEDRGVKSPSSRGVPGYTVKDPPEHLKDNWDRRRMESDERYRRDEKGPCARGYRLIKLEESECEGYIGQKVFEMNDNDYIPLEELDDLVSDGFYERYENFEEKVHTVKEVWACVPAKPRGNRNSYGQEACGNNGYVGSYGSPPTNYCCGTVE